MSRISSDYLGDWMAQTYSVSHDALRRILTEHT